MMEFIVTGATVKTAVVALRKARDAEESITARIRIQGALAELTNPIVHKSRPLPSQDYTEYLIDQDGNEYPIDQDGNAQQINITIVQAGDRKQLVEFTNVPMHRVHAAIAVLNGDYYESPADKGERVAKLAYNAMYGKQGDIHAYTDTDSMRTKDFTEDELFPFESHIEKTSLYCCAECGAAVLNVVEHTSWHNKTLP